LKRRLVAFAVAAVLVVGAFFIRREVIDSDDSEAGGSDPPGELVCITELADVCAALATDDLSVTVEDAGTTLDRLGALGDDSDPPLWLTIEP
jgi:hypothetical protein